LLDALFWGSGDCSGQGFFVVSQADAGISGALGGQNFEFLLGFGDYDPGIVSDFDSRGVTVQLITVPLDDLHLGPVLFETHFKPDVADVGVYCYRSEEVSLSVASD
jgi:hypothetical protein